MASLRLTALSLLKPTRIVMDNQNTDALPAALAICLGVRVKGFEDRCDGLCGGKGYHIFGGNFATVFEDPSIIASDIEISLAGSQVLTIRGTGFNNVSRPVLDFDPPLDSSNLNIEVSSREERLGVHYLKERRWCVIFQDILIKCEP